MDEGPQFNGNLHQFISLLPSWSYGDWTVHIVTSQIFTLLRNMDFFDLYSASDANLP